MRAANPTKRMKEEWQREARTAMYGLGADALAEVDAALEEAAAAAVDHQVGGGETARSARLPLISLLGALSDSLRDIMGLEALHVAVARWPGARAPAKAETPSCSICLIPYGCRKRLFCWAACCRGAAKCCRLQQGSRYINAQGAAAQRAALDQAFEHCTVRWPFGHKPL